MQVTFHEADHRYTDERGIALPSVTEVINTVLLTEEQRRVMLGNEAAMLRGTYVHKACQLLSAGDLDEDSLDPVLMPYVAGWAAFSTDSGYQAEAWEVTVGHATYRYAGRYDTRGRMGKHAVLLDIKTGGLPDTVGVQLAAYAEASGIKGLRRYAVQLPGDGRYKLVEYKDRQDWPAFCGALAVYNWKLRNGQIKWKGQENERDNGRGHSGAVA